MHGRLLRDLGADGPARSTRAACGLPVYYRDLLAMVGNDSGIQAFAWRPRSRRRSSIRSLTCGCQKPALVLRPLQGRRRAFPGKRRQSRGQFLPPRAHPHGSGIGRHGGNARHRLMDAQQRRRRLDLPVRRSDVSVTIRDGELAGWQGWNLVDYRTQGNSPQRKPPRARAAGPTSVRQACGSRWPAASWPVRGASMASRSCTTSAERKSRGWHDSASHSFLAVSGPVTRLRHHPGNSRPTDLFSYQARARSGLELLTK